LGWIVPHFCAVNPISKDITAQEFHHMAAIIFETIIFAESQSANIVTLLVTRTCPKLQSMTTNYADKMLVKGLKWLINPGASHNITSDLLNLSIYSEYDDIDAVYITQLKNTKLVLLQKNFTNDLNYTETFSHVIKLAIIQTVLSLTITHN
jgi:hypothetical protein